MLALATERKDHVSTRPKDLAGGGGSGAVGTCRRRRARRSPSSGSSGERAWRPSLGTSAFPRKGCPNGATASWRWRKSPSWHAIAARRMTRPPGSRRSSGRQPWRTGFSRRRAGGLRTRSVFICGGRGCEPDRIRPPQKSSAASTPHAVSERRQRSPTASIAERLPTRVLRLAEALCRRACNSPRHAPPRAATDRHPCAATGLLAGVVAFLFLASCDRVSDVLWGFSRRRFPAINTCMQATDSQGREP